MVMPEPLQLKQLYHLHIWPSQGQAQVLQGSLRSKHQWTTHNVEVEIKPQSKFRGSVAKEEDPKPSCTNCRLNPHDQLGRLCVYGIYKRSLKASTKENTLVLMAMDTGGKNTQE